jgi:ADP-ribosylglycohydrolase
LLGAITGDIVGSVYENHNIKTTDFPLFDSCSSFTDDTVLTVAVADALMEGKRDEKATERAMTAALKKYGRDYPNAGYGGMFKAWLYSDSSAPFNSFGNGSAMRVSPVGWFFDSLADIEKFAEISARVTHSHPEGIKGAQSVASAIFLARTGHGKGEIKKYVTEKYGYDLERTLDEIRPIYRFDVSCQGSVPEAIIAFLESDGFEDAIRKAVSIGGDSDTIAAITGSIAEAAYGVPDDIRDKALSILDDRLYEIYIKWKNQD